MKIYTDIKELLHDLIEITNYSSYKYDNIFGIDYKVIKLANSAKSIEDFNNKLIEISSQYTYSNLRWELIEKGFMQFYHPKYHTDTNYPLMINLTKNYPNLADFLTKNLEDISDKILLEWLSSSFVLTENVSLKLHKRLAKFSKDQWYTLINKVAHGTNYNHYKKIIFNFYDIFEKYNAWQYFYNYDWAYFIGKDKRYENKCNKLKIWNTLTDEQRETLIQCYPHIKQYF